jgi:sugar lactone lactonase YvrE
MMQRSLLLFLVLSGGPQLAHAACTDGVAGQLKWISADSKIEYCDGSSWRDTTQSTGASCSGTPAGTINYLSGDLRYCNGSNWISMKGSSVGTCSGTSAGTINWNSGTAKMRFCDASNWYDMTAGGAGCSLSAFSPLTPINSSDDTWSVFTNNTNNEVISTPLTGWSSSFENEVLSGRERNPSIFFKADGTKLYVVGSAINTVFQYSLATAWDLTSASFGNITFSVAAQAGTQSAHGLFFKSDGLKMYVLINDGNIYQYSLSTAWDVATASYDSLSFSIATQDPLPYSLYFKSDGTKLYYAGDNTDKIYQYTLSTAWNISTASYDSKSLATGTQDNTTRNVFFNSAGTKLYLVGRTNGRIHQYTLATAWDVSSGTYDSVSFLYSGQEANPRGLSFKSDGTKMYVSGIDSVAVSQYSLATAWDLSTASYDSVVFPVEGGEASPRGMTFKTDGTKMYLVGDHGTSKKVTQFSLSTAWDISTASYDNQSYSVLAQDSLPQDISFKSDGTKMYIIGNSGDKVYQYTLTTAWDISSASYSGVSFLVSGQDTSPQTITFKSDGTKMYVAGAVNRVIYQYTLSTAWDLSTAAYDSVSFLLSGQDSVPVGISFNSDGTKMFMTGMTSKNVYQYTIATAWDVSTATYDNVSYPVSGSSLHGMSIKPDGSRFYTVHFDTGKVLQYSRSFVTPFPAGMSSVSALNWLLEYRQQGRSNDTLGIAVRIMNGATVLAAADAGGTFATVNANVTSATDTSTGPTAFAYVNTAANKATWEAGSVEIRQSYTQNAGPDGTHIEVDWAQFTGSCL